MSLTKYFVGFEVMSRKTFFFLDFDTRHDYLNVFKKCHSNSSFHVLCFVSIFNIIRFSSQVTIMVCLTSLDCCRHPTKSLAYDVLVPGGTTAAMSKRS